MRSFAEEKKQGTLDLLLQSKLSQAQIIWGKFLSCLMTALFMLSLTIVFPMVLFMAGYDDWGSVISGYLGLIFCIICYTMVGVFASSLTNNQIVASLLSFCILLISMFLVLSTNATSNYMLGRIFLYLSIPFHYQTFAYGMIKSYNMVFLLSFGLFF
ncbi:MAG: ABC transporter permease subunit, partial [Halobacteriovoraceae bacterium]|nr:ABC transporter permease subunit [Halobacteriovoraceae bacterium]